MKIIFFDQNCGLCHFWVRSLMRVDRSHRLKFAPLFGETYQQFIPQDFHQTDSVIYYQDTKIWTHSDAVLMALSDLGLFYKCFYVFLLIPKIIRDRVYLIISINRQKLSCYFEKKEQDKFLP